MMSHGDMTWSSGLIPMIEPDVVTEIISRISDLALVISKSGKVLGVMADPKFKPKMGLADLEGDPFQNALAPESVKKFESRLSEFLEQRQGVMPVELNHRGTEAYGEFPMRYSFHQIGSDGAILMLGRDLKPIAEMQQQLVAAQIALEKDYEAHREFDTRFRVLMASAQEPVVFVSVVSGEVVECNPAAVETLGSSRDQVLGSFFADAFDPEGGTGLIERLSTAAEENNRLTMSLIGRNAGASYSIRPTLFRSGGEQMLLCRLYDQAVEKTETGNLGSNMRALYENGVDSMVFADSTGIILSANESFLNLSSVASAQALKGRSIGDFLSRGSVDLSVVLENAARRGAMRLYATKLISEHGAERPIEISITHLDAKTSKIFAFIIRDTSRVETVRSLSPNPSDVDMNSVIELIGSRSLKEIVAQTTDVVEKMCIETAVELTSNNRVAAAEMLGLSRQSLYVKLRKYDFLNKADE